MFCYHDHTENPLKYPTYFLGHRSGTCPVSWFLVSENTGCEWTEIGWSQLQVSRKNDTVILISRKLDEIRDSHPSFTYTRRFETAEPFDHPRSFSHLWSQKKMAPDLQPWPHGPWTVAPPPQWVARPWASEGPPRSLRSSPLGVRMRHQLLQAQLGYMGRFMCIYVYIVVIYYIWWYMVIYYQICIWWYMMIYYISKST